MPSLFFDAVYDSWKPIQLAKYRDLLPFFQQYVRKNDSLLDYGIGHGWLENYFSENHFSFSRITGFDLNPLVVTKKIENVTYVVGKKLDSTETFDLVCCIDTIHLAKNVDLMLFVKKNGYLFITIPNTFKERMPAIKGKLIAEREIGDQEKSFFQLWQNV